MKNKRQSMSNPKVSIITPSFNQGEFLEQTIKSVLAQDYENIEYIVIDGGSTDDSVDIIKKYENCIDYWVSEKDEGQSHAINKGFKKATGEIVAWLNSDDLYFPYAVSIAVQRFKENSDLSLFYGDCVFINRYGGFIRYFTEVEPYNQSRLLNYSDYIMQPTTFFSMKKLKEVKYLDETLHYAMDWDLWCKLCKVGAVHYEKSVIAANREYGSTKTNTGGWSRLKELFKLQRRHMTGFWPHAFFGFASTELHLRSERANSPILKKIINYAAWSVAKLSPSAVNYNYKANRVKYGLIPYSYDIPNGKAQLFLPAGGEYTLRITFPDLVDTIITVDQERIENNYYLMEVKDRIVSLEIEFKKSHSNEYCAGTLNNIELLREECNNNGKCSSVSITPPPEKG